MRKNNITRARSVHIFSAAKRHGNVSWDNFGELDMCESQKNNTPRSMYVLGYRNHYKENIYPLHLLDFTMTIATEYRESVLKIKVLSWEFQSSFPTDITKRSSISHLPSSVCLFYSRFDGEKSPMKKYVARECRYSSVIRYIFFQRQQLPERQAENLCIGDINDGW